MVKKATTPKPVTASAGETKGAVIISEPMSFDALPISRSTKGISGKIDALEIGQMIEVSGMPQKNLSSACASARKRALKYSGEARYFAVRFVDKVNKPGVLGVYRLPNKA